MPNEPARSPIPAPAPSCTDAPLRANTDRLRYQPFYCEENAWWLCTEPALGDGPHHAVFVLYRQGGGPLAAQRAVAPGRLCWWDYHVIVLDGSGRIWDQDSRLGCPVPAGDWLRGSFPFIDHLPAALRPWFRLVPAAAYRADFASDRSHMRDAHGRWLHPPPPWAPIGSGMRLPEYLATTGGPGELLAWDDFNRRACP